MWSLFASTCAWLPSPQPPFSLCFLQSACLLIVEFLYLLLRSSSSGDFEREKSSTFFGRFISLKMEKCPNLWLYPSNPPSLLFFPFGFKLASQTHASAHTHNLAQTILILISLVPLPLPHPPLHLFRPTPLLNIPHFPILREREGGISFFLFFFLL